MRIKFSDGKIITADSFEDFVKKMRRSSFFPGETVTTYMAEVSERLGRFDLNISTQDANTFAADLQTSGIITILPDGDA